MQRLIEVSWIDEDPLLINRAYRLICFFSVRISIKISLINDNYLTIFHLEKKIENKIIAGEM